MILKLLLLSIHYPPRGKDLRKKDFCPVFMTLVIKEFSSVLYKNLKQYFWCLYFPSPRGGISIIDFTLILMKIKTYMFLHVKIESEGSFFEKKN